MRKGIDLRIPLIFLTLSFICIGFSMIYSASALRAERLEKINDPFYYIKRQLIGFTLGCFGLLISSFIDYKILEGRMAWYLMILSIILLLLVFTPLGVEMGGARRWIKIGPYTFQPAEFAKTAFIIYLSEHLCKRRKNFLYPFLFTFSLFFLLMMQPNMGTALIFLAIAISMFFIAGIRGRHILLCFLIFAPVLLSLMKEPYRMRRIEAHFNPWEDPKGKGYHIIQSLVAIGSGGLKGVGLGESTQKLFFLPAAHTDFIFSILAEETGFVGASLTIFLFLLFLYLGIKICLRAKDSFGRFLVYGFVMQFGIQAFLNMAVVTGLVPTCGIPLPFISFGGSSLVFNMIGVGLICSVAAKL